jgi:trk system potassium uptake protein TrkA
VHVIVVGCGRVGSELASDLVADGHTVAVVDKNPSAFRRLPAGFERTVTGIGFDRDTLVEAGVEEAGAFAAVTSGDNSNIMSVRVAREVFGIDNVVARIYDPRRALIYQRLGINTVATVTWTTQQVLRRLMPERSATDWTHPTGMVALVERALPGVWAGRPLSAIEDPDRIRIVAVGRGGEARLPSPSLIGQEGDILHVAVAVEASAADVLDERLAAGPEDAA